MRREAWVVVSMIVALMCATCAPVDPPTPVLEPNAEKPASDQLQIKSLKGRIELAIDNVRKRDLQTTNAFWTVFHGILGLGPSLTLYDPKTSTRVNALEYVAKDGVIRGMEFIPTKDGLNVLTSNSREMTGLAQGHQDQFIAEMAQWGIPRDFQFIVKGKTHTYHDFLRFCKAKASVKENQELSWAIVCISQYFGTNHEWTNGAGDKLRFDDILRYELDADIENAACGGTHRLFGLTWAYRWHVHRGGQLDGIWKEIEAKTRKYKNQARKTRNSDGSFSTEFFRGPARDRSLHHESLTAHEMQARLYSTGHMFEWLALALSDEELREPWMEEAANALFKMFFEIRQSPMESGALYHAIHGLLIYYARVYGGDTLGPNRPYFPGEPLDAESFNKRMRKPEPR